MVPWHISLSEDSDELIMDREATIYYFMFSILFFIFSSLILTPYLKELENTMITFMLKPIGLQILTNSFSVYINTYHVDFSFMCVLHAHLSWYISNSKLLYFYYVC